MRARQEGGEAGQERAGQAEPDRASEQRRRLMLFVASANRWNRSHPELVAEFSKLTQGECGSGEAVSPRALRMWQLKHGLRGDGKVGPATVEAARTGAAGAAAPAADKPGAKSADELDDAGASKKSTGEAASSGQAVGEAAVTNHAKEAKPAAAGVVEPDGEHDEAAVAAAETQESTKPTEAHGQEAKEPASEQPRDLAQVPLAEAFALLSPMLKDSPSLADRADAADLLQAAEKHIFEGGGTIKRELLEKKDVRAAFAFLQEPGAQWQDHAYETIAAFSIILEPIVQHAAASRSKLKEPPPAEAKSGEATAAAVSPAASAAGGPSAGAAQASAAPLATAGVAAHDGDKDHALGQGDDVFAHDKSADAIIAQAFPANAEGVVAAAFYELHRGDKRSLAEIMADSSAKKTTRGAQAAHEGKHTVKRKDKKTGQLHDVVEGTNDDAAGSQTVGQAPPETHGKKVTAGGAVGPVEAYVASVGAHAGIPWCGSFATFVYARAGIDIKSLAYSLDVPNVLAASSTRSAKGAYFNVDGDEGSATMGKRKAYAGDLQQGESGKKQKYHKEDASSLAHLDVRAGDVFWQEHSASSGHVGIIVGVQRTAKEITLVSIEGNASDQVLSKVHTIKLDGHGKVDSTIKGWGRPAQLNGGMPPAVDDGAEPEWMENAEKRYKGKKDSGRDR